VRVPLLLPLSLPVGSIEAVYAAAFQEAVRVLGEHQ